MEKIVNTTKRCLMKDTRNQPKLQSGYTYHICNQGNNRENIFIEERNYYHFLKKYQQYIHPIANTYAYCLMPNHFHLMIQIKSYEQLYIAFPKKFPKPELRAKIASDICTLKEAEFDDLISNKVSRQFRNWFGGYARSINTAYNRKGKLFSLPFKRILINNDAYFSWLIAYIHRNPIHHKFCKDFTSWKYSSYAIILHYLNSEHPIRQKDNLIDLPFLKEWFDPVESYLKAHQESLDFLENKWILET